jgi:hypothetical protein
LYHIRGGTLKNAFSASFVRFRPRDVITCLNLPAWRHYSASLLVTPPPHSSSLLLTPPHSSSSLLRPSSAHPPPLLRPSSAPPPPFLRPKNPGRTPPILLLVPFQFKGCLGKIANCQKCWWNYFTNLVQKTQEMQSSSFKNNTIAWRRTPSHPYHPIYRKHD